MKRRDLIELFALAAIWGASFLFMRVAAPAFGPLPLAWVRVAGAALLLLPLLAAHGRLGALARHWRPIAVVGLVNSALPFTLLSYGALSISAGLAAIFNSASPLFAAVIAWLWLADRLTPWRIVGLGIGFAGVVSVAWARSGFADGGSLIAVAALLAATVSYGVAPSLVKRHLGTAPPLAIAAGSQVAAALMLAVPAALAWPAAAPSAHEWLVAGGLALLCTGVAFILYFRLIASAGPTNAIAVTFLVPVFAVAWGWIFLGETLTAPIVVGCAVLFAGTALTTGLVDPRRWRRMVAKPTPRRADG